MIEGDAKKSDQQWMGHTEHNVTVVWPKNSPPRLPGDLVSISIYDATPSTLYGIATDGGVSEKVEVRREK